MRRNINMSTNLWTAFHNLLPAAKCDYSTVTTRILVLTFRTADFFF
jgi:hypothetical protein